MHNVTFGNFLLPANVQPQLSPEDRAWIAENLLRRGEFGAPCGRSCEPSRRPDAAHRAENRSGAQRLALALLKDKSKLSPDQARDLDRLVVQFTTKRTARAWLYREQLRDILDRTQFNIVSAMLTKWCTNVMRSKVEPRTHIDGIVAWTRSRQTNGFIEAINGLFQATKRKARRYTRLQTIKTALSPIAGKLDFKAINPHAA
jgi:hypothetical protein